MSNLQERIQNKEIEVGKLVAKFDKYSRLVSEEFLALTNQFLRTGERNAIREYANRTYRWHSLEGADYDLYRTASDLYDARNTLEKYIKQFKTEQDKQATLNSMPEVIIEFKNNLIEKWDRFDAWKKQEIRNEYNSFDYRNSEERRTFYSNMNNKWGRGWYEFMYFTQEQIHNQNVKDAENIVLNLINRTIELCGTITDAQDLSLDSDNQGYLIINGIVRGEKGNARVESIGAGGYNIQRYHIRVLVKPVK